MKRFITILMALVMLLSLATTAFAADGDTTGTIVNGTDRTYNAYQIFKGTQADGDAVLGNIDWGTGIDSAGFLTALNTLTVNNNTPFASCTDAASVAAVLANQADESDIAKAFANLAAKHLGTSAYNVGAGSMNISSGYYLLVDISTDKPTQNPALLQVTNKSTLNIKEKTGVPSSNKQIKIGEDTYSNTTTSDIGQPVTFVLTATLPDTFEGYDSYKLIFHDYISKGLDYNGSARVFDGDGNRLNDYFVITEDEADNNGTKELKIESKDGILAHLKPGMVITVTYEAIVTLDAIIAGEGNPNTFELEYSNNPNVETETKKTPPKEVKVYTWEIPVFKYTGSETNKEALPGAGFTLYTDKDCTQPVKLCVPTENSNIYKVYKNESSPGNPDPHVTEILTGSTGKFEIEGLKAGTYYLKETTTPPGYNTCNVITVVIGDDGTLTQDGTATTEIGVLNNAGSTLPETGGMGTTLFYVFGGIMMLAAVVLLVTKKRMANAE